MVRAIAAAVFLVLLSPVAFAANDSGGGGKKETPAEKFNRQETERALTNNNAPKSGRVDTRRVGQPNQSTMDRPLKK